MTLVCAVQESDSIEIDSELQLDAHQLSQLQRECIGSKGVHP